MTPSSGQRISSYLAKSKEAADEMTILLNAGRLSGACDRAYYAVFHMAQAVLAQEGKEFSSHEAVISSFGRDLVKTGRIDPKYHRILREAFDLRLTADYDIESTVGEEAAKDLVKNCQDFLRTVEVAFFHGS